MTGCCDVNSDTLLHSQFTDTDTLLDLLNICRADMRNNNANHKEAERQHLFSKVSLDDKIQNVAITAPLFHLSNYTVFHIIETPTH